MNWDEYALSIAEVVAKKSKDPWRQVGAVLLRHDNTVAACGYNGFPPNMVEDWSCREKRRNYVVHAEQNALRHVKPMECYLLASTTLPCNNCLKSLASYGIRRIVYRETYPTDESTTMLASEFNIALINI
jgi:dCMP deaminase